MIMITFDKVSIFAVLLLAVAAVPKQPQGVEETTTAECVEFADKKRVEWLNNVVAKNGDIKGGEGLKPAEYEAMLLPKCRGIFSAETIEVFDKAMESLAQKQEKFLRSAHKEMLLMNSTGVNVYNNNDEWKNHTILQKIQAEFGGARRRGEGGGVKEAAVEKYGPLVLASKKLLMDIFSAEGEATRLDVHAFMQQQEVQWEGLKLAFELSKMQSAHLDRMIDEDMLRQHLANRRPQIHHQLGGGFLKAVAMRRAVIEGGGPAGLLTAFKLFMAGMDVTLVNDRPDYVRTLIVGYDASWMAALRYLLGTRYNQLFDDKFHPAGAVILAERGYIDIRYTERALKERLQQLAKFVVQQRRRGGGEIRLFYGFSVRDLEENPIVGNLNAKLENLHNRSEHMHIPSEHKYIPVDLLLCIGGANDKLRQHLFASSPRQRTRTVNYTKGTFKKLNHGHNINISKVPTKIVVKLESMRAQLAKGNFNGLIEQNGHLLQKHVHERFKDFLQMLLASDSVFAVLESHQLFSLTAKTPKPLDELFKAIDAQMNDKNTTKKAKNDLKEFDRRIRWMWCAAQFDYAYPLVEKRDAASTESFHVNIDQKTGDSLPTTNEAYSSLDIIPSATSSFDVSVRTMDEVAMERWSSDGKHSAVVAVLGDALANTHFYSGGAMSTGREGVEFLVSTIKEASLSDEIQDKNDFVQALARRLKKVTDDVVILTTKFVPDEVFKQPSAEEQV